MKRSGKLQPDNSMMGEFEFNYGKMQLTGYGSSHRLTLKEAELLKYFLIKKNQVLKREDILVELWGEDDYFLGRSLDVFISRIVNDKFKSSRNLGNKVNTAYNEIAFFLKDDYQGYLSSDKVGGKGSFDIYKFDKDDVSQTLQGIALDRNTQISLPNTLIILTDEEGREIGRQYTNEKGQYNFPVMNYCIILFKKVQYLLKIFCFDYNHSSQQLPMRNIIQ